MKMTKKMTSIVLLLTLMFTLIPSVLFAAATGAPGTPNLNQSKWDNSPDYTIGFDMWWGNNGTSWKLFENGTVIHTAALTENSPNAQSSSLSFTNKPSGTYEYKVDLINSFGTTTSSNLTYTVVNGGGGDTQAPSIPANLTSTGKTATSVALSWSASTDNVGVSGYEIYGGSTLLTTVSGTSHSVTGLTANTAYTFTVKAKDAAGNKSAASNAVTVTTSQAPADTQAPTTPANLTSTGKSSSSVALSWSAATDNVGVTGYEVYNGSVLVTTVTGTSHNVTGLSATTAYSFTVKAVDAAGNKSAASNALSVTTDAQSSVAPWAPNTAYAVNARVSYGGSIYKCLQAHTSLVGWEPSNTPTLWQVDTTGPDTTAPSAPTGLAASNIVTNALTLTWVASTDNIGVTGYDVYQGSALIGSVTVTTFNVTGLTASTAYTFTVKAKDAANNVSAASNTANATTLAPDTLAPTVPTNLAAAGTGATSTTLSWTASTDNVGVTGYNVYANGTLKGSASGTMMNVTGLTPNTTYSFTVKAKDAVGNLSAASSAISITTTNETTTSYKKVFYFASWGVYSGRNFKVADIDASKITHINYAFADICWNGIHGNPGSDSPNMQTWSCQDETGNINAPNGTIVQGDPWADTGISYPGDTWDTPIKGSFGELKRLKAANPHVKTIISVGGWTWSNRFSDVAADPITRANFANSAVNFLRKYSFDGVDLDWEYPVGGGLVSNSYRPADKQNYSLLLQEIRAKLDAAEMADGKEYTLTIAAGASPAFQNNTELDKIAQYCDWINIMTYDFHGGWDAKSGQNAPLYFDPADNGVDPQGFNVANAVQGFINNGVPNNKIVMGLPFYGRGWDGCANVNNGLYQTCAKSSTKGTVEAGSFDFWDLEANYINKNGYTRYWNDVTKTPWLFNASTGTFITYDDVQSFQFKTDYIKSMGLGGGMFWEFSGDKSKTLLNAFFNALSQ